jgi:hypothetical protein
LRQRALNPAQVLPAKVSGPIGIGRKCAGLDFPDSLSVQPSPRDKRLISVAFYFEDARWLQLAKLSAPGVVNIFTEAFARLWHIMNKPAGQTLRQMPASHTGEVRRRGRAGRRCVCKAPDGPEAHIVWDKFHRLTLPIG